MDINAMRSRTSLVIVALAVGASLSACNALTGVDDLEVDGDTAKTGNPSGTGGGGGAGTGGSGIGGVGLAGSGTGAQPPAPELVEAQGVTITEIAVYQGVKRPLMQNGAASTSKTPIVAGRDAFFRVFYTTDG